MRYARIRAMGLALGVWGVAILCGCSDSTPPASMHDRQERALKDPFNYSPGVGKPDDITGGDTGSLDKNGLQRDLNDVFNP